MKFIPVSTRKINGKKFNVDSTFYSKLEARKRARLARVYGAKARVIQVHNYVDGRNWAVFVREK